MKAHSSSCKMVQSVLQKVVKLQSYMGLKSYGYGKNWNNWRAITGKP